MAEIIPAIMPDDYQDLREKLALVSEAVSWVQIDVMDGRFVPSKSWPYKKSTDQEFNRIINEEEGLPFWDRLNFEVDLMVADPQAEAKKWLSAGAERLVLHLESLGDAPGSLIEEIKSNQVEVGLALDMKSPIEKVMPFLEMIDFVQLMGIQKPGFQGEPFDAGVIEKIKELKKIVPSTVISVDGGVNRETAPSLASDGADRLVIGSAIFGGGDAVENIQQFKMI